MSHDGPTIRSASLALERLVLGWDRYREAVADELGVGTTEIAALGFLYHDGPHTPSEIGHLLNLTSGSVTALLDRLEGAAFVTRSQNPDDRRSLLATATPAGRHAIQWYYDRLDEIVGKTLERVSNITLSDVITLANSAGELLIEQADEANRSQH
ncbi:MAG TPA: MarR family transcriptional regulator [Jatrophihabitantaceae bacterium]|nr:MarR family transcriptional regulator [Jatrophihabitantaceae bacterium]